MNIPFLDLFQKLRTHFFAAQPQPPAVSQPVVQVPKPSGDRRSKTVLPRVTAPRETTGTLAPKPFLPIPRTRELPPALAKALEPKLERAISLHLSDFLDFIPAEYVKPVEVIDADRSVTLKASEIEKGMPDRQPSISLPSLYNQIPEIFLRSVAPTDETRVLLPYEKVLEQFSSVQVRDDQKRDDRVPQLETPILQATLEDTERFGTKMEPVESSALPPVPVKPATAEAIASAEPEPIAKEIVPMPGTKSSSPHPVIPLSPSGAKPGKDLPPLVLDFKTSPPPPPLNIPFQFPPNGTGAPASERVPASSGPPVPPPSLPPLKLASGPTLAQDKDSPPNKKEIEGKSAAAPSKFTQESAVPQSLKLKPTVAEVSPALNLATEVDDHLEEMEEIGPAESLKIEETPTITLALKPILENIPIFQRADNCFDSVPDTARVKFALDLIRSQLASGRVLIPAKAFQLALPPAHRSLFVVDREETPVSLPLQEVLKNLPAGVLKRREGQQTFLPQEEFVTPISLKAKEDATRLQPVATEPPKLPEKSSPKEPVGPKEPVASKEPVLAAKIEPPPPEEKVDSKQVVAEVCKLPGVAACELMFPDGLSLSGNFPSEVAADGLCAMAPTLLQRINTHVLETKLGRLAGMTLYATESAITFFMTENICLAALHKDAAALPSDTRVKLQTMAEELSRNFTQPEMPHVNH